MATLYNSKFYHRDLSWLRFNHRVLQEATDKRNPLYERIKFLAIFSSNLDEFFKVRVSDIRQVKGIAKPLRKKLITKPNKVLKEIQKQVELQQNEFGAIFREQIIPDLKKEHIHLIGYKSFSGVQKEIAKSYFEEKVKDRLIISRFDNASSDQVFIENEHLYLAGQINKESGVIISIPKDEPRFFIFPKQNGQQYITFIDDILKYNLRQHHKEELDITFYSIKTSRDAELYIENELSGNLAQKINNALSKRDTGQSTRLLIDSEMSQEFRDVLTRVLDVSIADISLGGRYHNFKDFFKFPNPTTKKFTYESLEALPHPGLTDCDSIFSAVDKKDRLLHYPYQSFEPVIKWVQEAAGDPNVKKIKITIYRAAKDSALNDAIVQAIENGIHVTVFIEVKARFDEENNLKWGAIFEKKGGTVIYSYPDIKVHSKILYIERTVGDKTKSYAYIATGNFNENTAKIYTDFGLMTANKKITKEINRVFLVLDRTVIVPKTKRLLVSPFTTRIGFTALVQNEINLAMDGKQATITLKMNSLQDKDLIKLLYRANNAGVKIDLIVRGMCCLVPGIKGQSERIHVTSIVDRYLEHGRVYIFGNAGEPQVYIGSADWMTRNLNHRIEVVAPILDAKLKQQIIDLVAIQLKDNVKARIIDAKQTNSYVFNDLPLIQAQLETYNYLKKL